jgi:hypothetical protein
MGRNKRECIEVLPCNPSFSSEGGKKGLNRRTALGQMRNMALVRTGLLARYHTLILQHR